MANNLDVHLSVLNTIDRELTRLHSELNSFTSASSVGYAAVLSQINNLNQEIIRLSKALTKRWKTFQVKVYDQGRV